MKVYINAWEFDSGGGFDWYYDKNQAILEFNKEKENVKDFSKNNWKAFLLEYNTKEIIEDEITNEIDLILQQLIREKLYLSKL